MLVWSFADSLSPHAILESPWEVQIVLPIRGDSNGGSVGRSRSSNFILATRPFSLVDASSVHVLCMERCQILDMHARMQFRLLACGSFCTSDI